MYTLSHLKFDLLTEFEQSLEVDVLNNEEETEERIEETIVTHFKDSPIPIEWKKELVSSLGFYSKTFQGNPKKIQDLEIEIQNCFEEYKSISGYLDKAQSHYLPSKEISKEEIEPLFEELTKKGLDYRLEDYTYITDNGTVTIDVEALIKNLEFNLQSLNYTIGANRIEIQKLNFQIFHCRSRLHYSVQNYEEALEFVNQALALDQQREDVKSYRTKIEEELAKKKKRGSNAKRKTKKRRTKS